MSPFTTVPAATVDGQLWADSVHLAQGARVRRLRSVALTATGWLSMAMCVVLFLAEDGLGRFSNLGSSLTAVGIIAGLTATNALLLMLLLSARVSFIDKTLGQPRATALHSKLGDWVVAGLGVHAVFVLVGYSLMDGISWLDEFGLLWGEATDFILAVAGMTTLLVVVLSSIVAARRRLPYEVWHAIHLVSYVAVGLSIPHMFSMSGLLAQGAWQRAYWIAILVVTGAALLVFRFLVPLVTSLRHQIRVAAVRTAGPDAYSIEFTGRSLDRLGIQGGQYLHWRFLAKGLWWHQHPFSVSAAPRRDQLRVTVRTLGRGTAQLQGLRPGTRVMVEGPYGTFTASRRAGRRMALVAAGIGITPIRAILEEARFAPGDVTVILRSPTPGELYLLDEIKRLCQRKGARLISLTGHRAPGRWVPATAAETPIGEWIPNVADTDLYVCGPAGFIDSVVAEARAAGASSGRIHTEKYDW